MNHVWLVVRTDYDEYSILGAFSSEARAGDYVAEIEMMRAIHEAEDTGKIRTIRFDVDAPRERLGGAQMERRSNRCPKCGEVLPTLGFTREDVHGLRLISAGNEFFESLADRISALLPPEETK